EDVGVGTRATCDLVKNVAADVVDEYLSQEDFYGRNLLTGFDGDGGGLGAIGNARVVHPGVTLRRGLRLIFCRIDAALFIAGADEVAAWSQAEEAILAEVVGLSHRTGIERAFPAVIALAKGGDPDRGKRLAIFVENTAGDDGGRNHPELKVLEPLAGPQRERGAGIVWFALTVFLWDIAGASNREQIGA